MLWWQQIITSTIPAALVLLAVLLGGWLVFRARTITMPAPFIPQKPRKNEPNNYARDLFGTAEDITDDSLSPAAARLRAQKGEPLTKQEVLSVVTGKGG